MIGETNNLILIMNPLEKAVAGAVIEAFSRTDTLTNNCITVTYFFLSLEWYIAEKHPYVFSLQ